MDRQETRRSRVNWAYKIDTALYVAMGMLAFAQQYPNLTPMQRFWLGLANAGAIAWKAKRSTGKSQQDQSVS